MKNAYLRIFAIVAALALLIPAGAIAKPGKGKGKGNDKASDQTTQVVSDGGENTVDDGTTLDSGTNGKGKGKSKAKSTKLVTANLKGVVTANDGVTMTVTVAKASGHVKACKGKSLTFDVSTARFHTADNDADGDMDAVDVLVGHEVKVQTKVARTKGRKTTCSVEAATSTARQVHNRTTPQPDEAEEAEETEGEETEGTDGEETEVESPEGTEVEEPTTV